MENESTGIAWVGNMFQKFEDMCLEVDDIVRQEGLKYVEDQLQNVGANVKQFCSEFVRDVLSTSFVDTDKDSADKLSPVAKDGVTKEISKDGIVEGHLKEDLSSSLQSVKGKEKESYSEEDVNARKRLEVLSILEKWLEEKYAEHLMSDKILVQKNDEVLLKTATVTDDVPGSSSYTKTNSIGTSSHTSASFVDFCESMVLDGELSFSSASAESIAKQHNMTGSISDLGSSYEAKLDGSCILVDRTEFGYVSGEARSSSYEREVAAKQGHDHGPAEFCNSNLGSMKEKDGGVAASTGLQNDGSFESDWEIV